MTRINSSLDGLLEQWYFDVYRFNFLLSCHGDAAREITFQTYLYAGADAGFPEAEEAAAQQLFSYAAKTCDDYFLRHMRRISSREKLQQSVSFPISDALWHFLKLPAEEKGILFLHFNMGFSKSQISEILKLRSGKVSRVLSHGTMLPLEETAVILPDSETADQISDELYLRFEERSVGLENRLRSIRLFMDHAILWIAMGILALCAAAVFYTSRL